MGDTLAEKTKGSFNVLGLGIDMDEQRRDAVAGIAGLRRGVAEFIGAVPDAVLWVAGKAAKGMGADVDTKAGIMSGHWTQDKLGDLAERAPVVMPMIGIPLGTHDRNKETPRQKDLREMGAMAGEGAGIVASFFVPPLAAASLPAKIAIPAATVGAPMAQGFIEGYEEERQPKKTAQPLPAPKPAGPGGA